MFCFTVATVSDASTSIWKLPPVSDLTNSFMVVVNALLLLRKRVEAVFDATVGLCNKTVKPECDEGMHILQNEDQGVSNLGNSRGSASMIHTCDPPPEA